MSTRPYSSDRRAAAAAVTRRRILDAAQAELHEIGYHAMTVSSLARRAQVAPQTIYNAVGGKAAVVSALYDVLLAGDDDDLPISARPEFEAVLNQPDAESTLRTYVGLGRLFYERVGDLLGMLLVDGPGADTDLRAFVAKIESERRTGNESVLRHITERFGPPGALSPIRAADVLWTATSFELSHRLVRRCGWSLDELEQWLGDVVTSSICNSAAR